MRKIRVIVSPLHESAARERWDDFVRQRDAHSGYLLAAWMRVVQKAFGHKAYPLAALRGDTVAGVLPLIHVSSALFGSSLVSLPFVNYGGILADGRDAAQNLADAARRLSGELGAESVELRHSAPSMLGLPAKTAHKVSMILDLPPEPETLWKNFKDKVRNQVRKAQKNGLTVEKGRKELLDDFYRVFCRNMRDLGTPVYAKSFFAAVLENFPEVTEILCVRQGKLPVAAGVLYAYGDTMQMPWASSLSSHRNNCPNHLLYWEALRLSASSKFARFDFGRSTPASGPWRFKKQWGAREVPLFWEYVLREGQKMPALSVANPKFQAAITVWKKLPLAVANFIGPKIVRGIP